VGTLFHSGLLMMVWVCFQADFASAQPTGAEPSPQPFLLEQEDVVAFTGGANMVAAQHSAHLETLLALSFSQKSVRFRNLAWEGDTVFEQAREMNFGSWPEQLERVGASVVFAQFGQMESLQGPLALPRFVQAYGKLLDEFTRRPRRIVLLSPVPFEKAQPPLPDLSVHNEDLRLYVEAIRDFAQKRHYGFVDLFTPFRERAGQGLFLTVNGLHLGQSGQWAVAQEASRQLGLEKAAQRVRQDPASGALRPDSVERLRAMIQAKNRLWFDYWRPMNWAFLRGDRTEQPSSRDHRDPKVRWFPTEMEKFPPLIEAKEKAIAKLAVEIGNDQ